MSAKQIRFSQDGGTLLGLLFGLLVGVLISFGVVWYLNRTPLPFVDKVTKSEPKQNGNPAQTPLALPGKPGGKPEERKFDFYDILEGKKQATPAGVPAAARPEPPPEPAVAAPVAPGGGALFLQVGAFQKKGDAENLRARLAMLGFEAGVLEVDVPEKGTMHRVRIGPYANPEGMNRARTQLSQHGVPATVVRTSE